MYYKDEILKDIKRDLEDREMYLEKNIAKQEDVFKNIETLKSEIQELKDLQKAVEKVGI